MGGKKKSYSPESNPVRVSEPELLYAIRENKITSKSLIILKQLSGLKDEFISTSLNMSLKTFRNYRGTNSPLKPHQQEHITALIALYKHGISLFGDNTQFNTWLQKSNYFFDNDQPLNFLTTISGIRYVDDRMTAIEYGDNA